MRPAHARGPAVAAAVLTGGLALASVTAGSATASATAAPGVSSQAATGAGFPTPIQHVVIIYQENHSFDNVLGRFCVQTKRCDGTTTARLHTGATMTMAQAPDIVPNVLHDTKSQVTAVDGGKMDGFDRIAGCTATANYGCLTQYDPTQIPNLAGLATSFAVSDRTFTLNLVPSWGGHLELATTQLDGFTGDNPVYRSAAGTPPQGNGWGCDSNKDTPWRSSAAASLIWVPSCVPKPDGTGPYRASPVPWVPTIMDRLSAAGRSWRLYGAPAGIGAANTGYGWDICPTFADCLYTKQAANVVQSGQILTDAQNGRLPNFAAVMPDDRVTSSSQHNNQSMGSGDNWIGSVVSAIEKSSDWNSTAIFITYDDCGCFYDHVPPAPGLGIRVPMVIVGPYVKAGYTDSSVASYASMLAFAEHTLGVAPLGSRDKNAYDYMNAFDFSQQPRLGLPLANHRIPQQSRTYLQTHPADTNDPT